MCLLVAVGRADHASRVIRVTCRSSPAFYYVSGHNHAYGAIKTRHNQSWVCQQARSGSPPIPHRSYLLLAPNRGSIRAIGQW